MATYTMTCTMGHDEPFTATVQAENDDEALAQLMDQLKPHLGEKHPDMAGKSDDELKEMIKGMWTKEEGGDTGGAPMAGGMDDANGAQA